MYVNTWLEELLYCESDWTQEQGGQRGCGVSAPENTQNLTGQDFEQLGLVDPVLSRGAGPDDL